MFAVVQQFHGFCQGTFTAVSRIVLCCGDVAQKECVIMQLAPSGRLRWQIGQQGQVCSWVLMCAALLLTLGIQPGTDGRVRGGVSQTAPHTPEVDIWRCGLPESHQGKVRSILHLRSAAASECRAPRVAGCRREAGFVGYGRPRSRAVWRRMSGRIETPSTPNTADLRPECCAVREDGLLSAQFFKHGLLPLQRLIHQPFVDFAAVVEAEALVA